MKDRELNKARPDIVDQPARTARTIVHHHNSTQYCSTDCFINIPLPPDQHHSSDVAKWRYGTEMI